MKSLIIRTVSALAALVILFLTIYFFDVNGLRFLCFITPFLGVRELRRILFSDIQSFELLGVFSLFTILVFALTVLFPNVGALVFASLAVFYCALILMFQNKFQDLNALCVFHAKSLLGFFYVGLLPATACMIINLPNGKLWFYALLAVVLCGDSMAYLVGISIGKHKVMPVISPKKTFEGAIGGLIGSGIVGAVMAIQFLPHVPLLNMILLSILTGAVAQFGDFFESLLKRVANIKDSGRLMPGHGGILDRLDGVLFGAPIILAGALWVEVYLKSLS